MKIHVIIQNEHVIPDTAELIGMNEKLLMKRFRDAQKSDTLCVFEAEVTPEQWKQICDFKERRKAQRRGKDRRRS